MVINLRKFSFKTISLFASLGMLLFFIHHSKGSKLTDFNINYSKIYPYIFSSTLPVITQVASNNSFSNIKSKSEFLYSVILGELPVMNSLTYITETDENDVSINDDNSSETTSSVEHAQTSVTTQVVENNVPNKYTDDINGVYIKNGTNYEIPSEVWDTSNLDINKNDVIIFHSHTCESYTPTEACNYEESGNFRTTDLNFSVARVGSVLTDQLLSYGFNTIHDTTYHDYPNYSGSYGRSMATVENLLLSHSGTDIIIDLHRDAIADSSYAPSVIIGDEKVAQLMFVIGTDGGGLEHPNWKNNLKFAVAIQQKANELYPGLFRSILLRNSRYNQHLGNAACIIEVGATGNTLEESMGAMKYLALVLNSVLH